MCLNQDIQSTFKTQGAKNYSGYPDLYELQCQQYARSVYETDKFVSKQ